MRDRVTAGLRWVMAYQRPFRAEVARYGLVVVAPASVAFALATLVVSALWLEPVVGHRAVAACCAWRAAEVTHGYGALIPLFGSAFLVRRPVEAIWTVAATWLVLGPLEAAVGSRRLLLVGALGHAVPTVVIDLCWLAANRADGSLAGIDVGTSAVVVTAATALAVSTRSLPLGVALAAGLAVDVAAAPDLATAEHLIAVVIGIGGALVLLPDAGRGGDRSGPRDPPPRPPAQVATAPHRYPPHA
jgi:energy-converting hydrogenase Eha subunit E